MPKTGNFRDLSSRACRDPCARDGSMQPSNTRGRSTSTIGWVTFAADSG